MAVRSVSGTGPSWAWAARDGAGAGTAQQPIGERLSQVSTLTREWTKETLEEEPAAVPKSVVWQHAQWLKAAVNGLVIVCVLLVVSIAAFTETSNGAEYVLAICEVVVLLLAGGYGALRLCSGTRPTQEVPLTVAWLLCFMLCVSPPTRKHQLLGDLEYHEDVQAYCEEGSTAMWLALVLALVAALLPMSGKLYGGFAISVVLQYAAIGFALPRPECNRPWAKSGPLLFMPPLAVSLLQLCIAAAALSFLQLQLALERFGGDRVLRFQLWNHDPSSPDAEAGCGDGGPDAGTNEFVLKTNLEKLVDNIESEEWRWRLFVEELQQQLPEASAGRSWLGAIEQLMDEVATWCTSLRSQASSLSSQINNEHIISVMHDADMNLESVSQFVDTTSVTRKISQVQEGGGSAAASRRKYQLQTIPGLSVDLKIGEWDFDAIAVNRERGGHVLQVVGFEVLRTFRFFVRDTLTAFLEKVEGGYVASNPYHSHIHAADMCNSFLYLITKCGLWRSCDLPETSYAAMLIAAIGHDVGHFGRTNMFLITRRHELAITYNDRSVLECFHASTLVRAMEDVKDGAKLFQQSTADQVLKVRQMIVNLILATDTQKHLDELAAFRVRLGADNFDAWNEANDQQTTFSMLFRAADIGHSAKPWEIHEQWSKRVSEEFHLQGDEEKRLGLKVSPLCERENFRLAASQSGFLQFICLPTWRELAKLEEHVGSTRKHTTRGGSLLGGTSPTPGGHRKGGKRSRLSVTHASVRVNTPDGASRKDSPDHFRSSKSSVVPTSTPSVPENSSDRRTHTRRWLAETCLTQCEDNFQAWKVAAELDRDASNSGSRTQSRHDSGTTPLRTSTGSRHNTHNTNASEESSAASFLSAA